MPSNSTASYFVPRSSAHGVFRARVRPDSAPVLEWVMFVFKFGERVCTVQYTYGWHMAGTSTVRRRSGLSVVFRSACLVSTLVCRVPVRYDPPLSAVRSALAADCESCECVCIIYLGVSYCRNQDVATPAYACSRLTALGRARPDCAANSLERPAWTRTDSVRK